MSEISAYWIEIADYDLETAKAMLVSKRYLYVGFMCHQVIEKTIKAYYSSAKEDVPPYSHNLKSLAEKCELLPLFSEEQLDFIEELLPMNLRQDTRPTKKKCSTYLRLKNVEKSSNKQKFYVNG
jgi:HEPN domain-containing protein